MKIKNNLISGFFASVGGVLTKVGFGFGEDGTVDTVLVPYVRSMYEIDPYALYVKYLIHICCMGIAITTSGLMYTYYVKSMQENGAAKATVYNFAVNYIGSIVFGFLFFNELVTQRLLFGMVLILLGTLIISSSEQEKKDKVKV